MLRQTTLVNGVRMTTLRVPHLRMAHARICYNVGSAAEYPAEWGALHFIEHMVFTGHDSGRPDYLFSRLPDYGASVNAFTDMDRLSFCMEVPARSLGVALALWGRRLEGFVVQESDVEVERQPILAELAMVQDDPHAHGVQLLEQALLGDYAHPVLGTPGSIQQMSAERLCKFYRKHLDPEKLVVAAVGNLDHAQLTKSAGQRFGHLRGDGGGCAPPQSATEARRCHVQLPDGQTHVFCGWRAPGRHSPDRHAFAVATRVLAGDGTDTWARLWRRLRTELGLLYTVGGYYRLAGQAGVFGIVLQTGGLAADAINAVTHETRRFRQGGPSRQELTRAIAMLRSDLYSIEDSPSRRSEWLVDRLIHGEEHPIHQARLLNEVDEDDALRVASTYLRPEDAVLITIGPAGFSAPA